MSQNPHVIILNVINEVGSLDLTVLVRQPEGVGAHSLSDVSEPSSVVVQKGFDDFGLLVGREAFFDVSVIELYYSFVRISISARILFNLSI